MTHKSIEPLYKRITRVLSRAAADRFSDNETHYVLRHRLWSVIEDEVDENNVHTYTITITPMDEKERSPKHRHNIVVDVHIKWCDSNIYEYKYVI